MQRKLGLLADLDLEEQDQELVEGLLKTMHETGETVGCLLSNSMHNRLCSSWNLWPHDSQAAVRTVTPPYVPANNAGCVTDSLLAQGPTSPTPSDGWQRCPCQQQAPVVRPALPFQFAYFTSVEHKKSSHLACCFRVMRFCLEAH